MYFDKKKQLIASDTVTVKNLHQLKLDLNLRSLNDVIVFLIKFKEAHELKGGN